MRAGPGAGGRDRDRDQKLKHENAKAASGSHEQERIALAGAGHVDLAGALAGGEHIDYVQMAENLLQSRRKQRATALMGITPAGLQRTCKHRAGECSK